MYCEIEKFKSLSALQSRLRAAAPERRGEILAAYLAEADTDFLKRICGYIWGDVDFKVSSRQVGGRLRRAGCYEALPLDDREICEYLDGIPRGDGKKPAVDLCIRIYGSMRAESAPAAELFLNILDKDFGCGVSRETVERVWPGCMPPRSDV